MYSTAVDKNLLFLGASIEGSDLCVKGKEPKYVFHLGSIVGGRLQIDSRYSEAAS